MRERGERTVSTDSFMILALESATMSLSTSVFRFVVQRKRITIERETIKTVAQTFSLYFELSAPLG